MTSLTLFDPDLSFDSVYPRSPLLYPHSTSVERLENLESRISSVQSQSQLPIPQIFISREDSNSGLGGGGNKIRKLEYVVHDARTKGATVLVTTGGQQSNHMRQVAAAAAKLKMKCYLLPKNALQHDTADRRLYNEGANVQSTELMSSKRHGTQETTDQLETEKEKILDELRSQGEVPYWIPSGASTHPLGGLGYARFAFELDHQQQTPLDAIFVACNSGSTLGGLIAGFKLIEQTRSSQGWKIPKLIGVDTFSGRSHGVQVDLVLNIARNTAGMIGVHSPQTTISKADFVIDKRFAGDAYGKLDENVTDAIKTVASTEGILLDPVYTGKAFAALLHSAAQGEYQKTASQEPPRWLFIHTGGVPVIGAYPDLR